jgi:hypothetical protein
MEPPTPLKTLEEQHGSIISKTRGRAAYSIGYFQGILALLYGNNRWDLSVYLTRNSMVLIGEPCNYWQLLVTIGDATAALTLLLRYGQNL